MKKKYKIGQIITWEERNNYFWNFEYPKNEEYDLLNMEIVDDSKPSIFNSPIGILFKNKKERDFRELENYDLRIITMWVKRPNNYKVGDEVQVNFALEGVSE